jgi:hypothetical protein
VGGQNAVPAENHRFHSHLAVIAALSSPLHNTDRVGRTTK